MHVCSVYKIDVQCIENNNAHLCELKLTLIDKCCNVPHCLGMEMRMCLYVYLHPQ
jgi:hypothetical protein